MRVATKQQQTQGRTATAATDVDAADAFVKTAIESDNATKWRQVNNTNVRAYACMCAHVHAYRRPDTRA